MKKIKLLSAAFVAVMALAGTLTASAQLTTGDYIIKNVATGKFFGGANAWGTQASLLDHGTRFTVTALEDGKYTLDSHTYNNANNHFLNGGYVDGASAETTIEAVSGGYIFTQGETYYAAPAEGTVVATDASASDANAVWQFISLDDAIADLKNATKDSPLDATFLLKNGSVSRNLYNQSFEAAWTVEDGCTNKNLGGGDNTNQCAESWKSVFDINQTVTGIPNGVYQLTAQASTTEYTVTGEDIPYVYINNGRVNFNVSPTSGQMAGGETSMAAMSASFTNGLYPVGPVEVVVTDGTIKIGVKGTRTDTWCIWDNFVLTYLGEKNFTDYIVNADLSTTDGWDATGTKGISGGQAKAGSSATYDFKQTIVIPAGQYKLTAQAAYRYSGSEADEQAAIAAGTETHYAKLYATVGTDETSVNVKNRWEGATDAALEGTSAVEVNGKFVPNSSADVLTYMKAGKYDNEVIFNITEEGPVTIGIKKTDSPSVGDYGNIGAWKLERLGDPDPTAAIKANMEAAEAIQNEKMEMTAYDALGAAFAAAQKAVESGEGIADANTALKTAIATAQTSITTYAKAGKTLANMKALVDATNVYTAEALQTYYTDPAEKYETSTLTNEEAAALQDPSVVTGWRADVTVDDLLMSASGVAVQQWGDIHTNTWSTEGDTDGSNFCVPFTEYWTNDSDPLGEKTITYTLDNVPAGKYDVSAWVRVRLNNNSTDQQATGITFQANDGDAVDACAGTQVGDTQFRLMEVKARGAVAEDGKLAIKFNVAAENNISWLSFKNVNYAKYIPVPMDTLYTAPYAGNGYALTDTTVIGTFYEYEDSVVLVNFDGFGAKMYAEWDNTGWNKINGSTNPYVYFKDVKNDYYCGSFYPTYTGGSWTKENGGSIYFGAYCYDNAGVYQTGNWAYLYFRLMTKEQKDAYVKQCEEAKKIAAIEDIVALKDGDTFIADTYTQDSNNLTADGKALLAGYYFDKKVYLPMNATVATNKGSNTIDETSYKNSLRVKGTQNYIVFKSGVNGSITVYTQSHSSRVFKAATDEKFTNTIATSDLSITSFTFDVTAGQVIYFSGFNQADNTNGDLYIAGFKVSGTEPTAVKAVSAANANAANGKYLKNGKVVIVKNGKMYNAAGAQLK